MYTHYYIQYKKQQNPWLRFTLWRAILNWDKKINFNWNKLNRIY